MSLFALVTLTISLGGLVASETLEINDWVVSQVNQTTDCICDGVGPEPTPTTPCYCYNGVYEYRSPNTLLGSFLGNTSSKPAIIDFDPFFNRNVNNISSSPFWKVPWWFNTTVNVPKSPFALLKLHGVNYKADIMVGGKMLITSDTLVGTFRHFAFDVTDFVELWKSTSLTLKITPPVDHTFPDDSNSTDLAITFVDWNPEPADRSMGIIDKAVVVTRDLPLDVTGLSSDTTLNDDGSTFETSVSFVLTVYRNITKLRDANLVLRLSCLPEVLKVPLVIPSNAAMPYEARIFFNSSKFKVLQEMPQDWLWNPWQMGKPVMHSAEVSVETWTTSGREQESILFSSIAFRQVTAFLDAYGSRQFVVNGNPILIRGGGWSPDMYYRANDTLLSQQLQLVRDMGLNSIRLEGKFMWDGFFEQTDRAGIMVLPGWCCCDSWQHWGAWGPQQYLIAAESLRSQLRRLAHHPSVIMFFYSSDQLPPASVEELYLNVFAYEAWPNPIVSSASATPSNISGPSGVKMSGPYAWVPPAYWLLDSNESFADLGGAWGFLTEGGPGASPMTLSSWNMTVPSTELWSSQGLMGASISFHCASPKGWFRNLRYFAPALDARYGESPTVTSALYRSQVQAFEGIRAMFEGYTNNKHRGATGVIQWMMNNAWPSHLWHLFDFYLTSGGSYYGAKRACAPISMILSYADWTVTLINSNFETLSFTQTHPLTVESSVIALNGSVVWKATANITTDVASDAAIPLPALAVPSSFRNDNSPSDVYFVRLRWSSHDGESVNDYWFGRQMDVLNWTDSHWYITHVSSYANFSALNTLARSSLSVSSVSWSADPRGGVTVSLKVSNAGTGVAFAVQVVPTDGGNDVRPAMMSDAFFVLLPGEIRTLSGWLPNTVENANLGVRVETYNDAIHS